MNSKAVFLISAIQTLKANAAKIGKGFVIIYAGGRIKLKKGARLVCENNARLYVNQNTLSRRDRIATIRIDENAELKVSGRFSLYYDCDIVAFPGSHIHLGSGYINSGLKLRCANSVSIGNEVAIATDLTLLDSDHHSINGLPVQSKPIVIEDHVWIGSRVTILKGVTIGEGSVIAAGSIVTKDIPAFSLAMGAPAKIVKSNVRWE